LLTVRHVLRLMAATAADGGVRFLVPSPFNEVATAAVLVPCARLLVTLDAAAASATYSLDGTCA